MMSKELNRLRREVSALEAAISWLEAPFVKDDTSCEELRARVKFCVADAEKVKRARQALQEPTR